MKSIEELVYPASIWDGKSPLYKLIERVVDDRFSKKCQDQITNVEWDVEDVAHLMINTLEADLFEQV